jgi:hypothetical protein
MLIEVTRDSVAAGDDLDPPHRYRLDLPEGASIASVVEAVLRAPYLPSILGGRATWVLSAGPEMSGEPVAVAAFQWSAPRYLVDPAGEFTATALHCHYWAQHKPDAVYEAVRHPTETPSVGQPGDLPDADPTGRRWWL